MADSAARHRVVIASRIFLPEPAAASFRLASLARALRDAGAEVTVLTTTAPGHPDAGGLEGIEVRRFPAKRDRDGYVRGYLNYLSFDVPLTARLLRGPRPAVVVVEPPPTTAAAVCAVSALRRVPFVYYAADIWSDAAVSTGAPELVINALRLVETRSAARAAAVLSVSDGVTERLAALGVGRAVSTVGNGVDVATFRMDGEGIDGGGPTLVYAGTASEFQGASIFVEAFSSVLPMFPDARLVFMGQGSEMPEIQAMAAAQRQGAIRILGRQPPEVAAAWLRGAHASLVSVIPGVGYDFARPTKAFASAACGTPVLFAGPQAGRSYIAEQQLGWAVEYRVAPVAEAMRLALAAEPAPMTRERLAAWAQDNVSLAAVSRRAAEIVLDVAGKSR